MSTSSRTSPTLRRRRLEGELERLRHEAGLTSTEVARRLDWSQGKLSKMESGQWVRPNPRDVEDLCRLYGVDGVQREELVQLARDSREKDGWWYPYRRQISEAYSAYIGLEAGAAELFAFEPIVVHGLLQTEAYARAIYTASATELSAEQIEQRVKIRAERQELLTRPDDPLRLWIVMHEAALHARVGDEDVMRGQLQHLIEISRLAKVTIQVIPFAAGAHAGMAGAFTILAFPDPADPDAAYVDNPAGQQFIENPEEVKRFQIAFQRLQAKALPIEDSLRMIGDMADPNR